LAAFFTTSLFSSDQHLHSNHRRRQMITAMNKGDDAAKHAVLRVKDVEIFAKPTPLNAIDGSIFFSIIAGIEAETTTSGNR
jgi:hypothetical protein